MCLFHKPGYPIDQVYWYQKTIQPCKSLKEFIKVDVAIIGGGMAGLHAAQAFKKRGLSVALLEAYQCGSGASGKSSGFITPNSELGLEHYYSIYGPEKAKKIWEFVCSGVEDIRNNIKNYAIACDYQEQNTLVLANSSSGVKDITKEHTSRLNLNYESDLYNAHEIQKLIGSDQYKGGNRYNNTFAITAYAYLQKLKEILTDEGVQIFEETPVMRISQNDVITTQGSVNAQYIVVCADRFIPSLGKLKKQIYHVQTSLMISSPLCDKHAKQLFPQSNMMVWDTDLVYQYFRLTGDNRLLLGGGSVWSSYLPWERHNAYSMYNKLLNYWQKKFPEIPVQFEYMWPGMIGISKDLVPVAGPDKDNPHIFYVGAATGLPWAAALGKYSTEYLLDKRDYMDQYFSPYRSFLIGGIAQTILGNPITFGLCDFYNVKIRPFFRK